MDLCFICALQFLKVKESAEEVKREAHKERQKKMYYSKDRKKKFVLIFGCRFECLLPLQFLPLSKCITVELCAKACK